MNDAPSSESVQARAVFLFENERYSPISGWSAKGLLPTDRNAFTTSDTMHGYHSIPEATTAFVCAGMIDSELRKVVVSTKLTFAHFAGWDWLPQHDWTVDMNLDNIDLEGWTYSVDFGSLKDETCGSRTKGAMHFVRRRRWVRFQYFDGEFTPVHFTPRTSPNDLYVASILLGNSCSEAHCSGSRAHLQLL